ncbi:ABC transporter permease [Tessaracoccus defluvii]|uniref:ABC transporter permease subunit n=1 Tax=Tessaracoccus defluvii TaxID=1285901 RepID=A0A7H0H3Z7_9ACTN|nr:ABC transporter permease subunit [Tessaracoccus defluvii]QNP55263.1 ABC transporter permease subunit [Tessaracoccus defluvii]
MIAFPAGYSIWLSFMKTNQIGQIKGFVGLDNYAALFREPMFGPVVANTLTWLVVVVSFTMVLSLALATFMNTQPRGERFLRFCLIVPWASALVMTSTVWRFILEGRSGMLNRILNDLGILVGYPDWFKDPSTAFMSVMLVGIVTSIPFSTYVLLGGMKTVPTDLIEAAGMDGASSWHTWTSVVLPSIRPTIFVAMVLNLLHVFNAFTIIWVITGASAGNIADTTVTWLYKIAFTVQLDMGKAAALGALNFLFLIVLIVGYMFLARPLGSDGTPGRTSLLVRALRESLSDWAIGRGIALRRLLAPLAPGWRRTTGWLRAPLATLVAIIISLFFLMPYIVMFLSSLKTTKELWSMPATYLPTEWRWENYIEVWNKIDLAQYFRVSLTVAGLTTLLVLVVALPAAYIVSRAQFRGRSGFLALILMTQMLPGVAVVIGIYREAVLVNAIGEYWFIILVNTAFNLAFAVWLLYANIAAVPIELDEAATIDGLGRLGILIRVITPLISGGLVTVIVYTFIGVWNEFLLALTVFNDPSRERVVLTVGINKFVGVFETNYQYLFAASLMAIVPAVVLFSLIERRLVGGLTAGAVK